MGWGCSSQTTVQGTVLHTPATQPLVVEARCRHHPCDAAVAPPAAVYSCEVAAICGPAASRMAAAAAGVVAAAAAAAAVEVAGWLVVAVKLLLQPCKLSFAFVVVHMVQQLLICC